jgi:hypothetical protein
MNQIFLALGAMMLLSGIVLTMNNSFIGAGQDTLKAEIGITAVSLGTSVIEEASGMAFDNKTDTVTTNTTASLTAAASLGPENGQTYGTFNDFDDWNNYDTTYSLPRSGKFHVQATVTYVSPSAPNTVSATPTWDKKITVKVSSPSMQDTLKMEYVYSYFYFR